MTDQIDYEDDFLDGCAIDFNEYADDKETQELRALFPEGERSVIAESEWRALFREEDLAELDQRYLSVLADETIRGVGAYSGEGRDLGIAARLRAVGLKVVEVAGWQTRGIADFHPRLSVDHHTASAKGSNVPALGICINGRSDLPGPLCHVLIARDNTCYVIASGKANHAGLGGFFNVTGNSNCYGVERENTGTGTEPWREDQRVTAAKCHAALLKPLKPEYQRVCEHKEWAPTRKIDAWDQTGPGMRTRVANILKVPAPAPAPTPTPTPVEEEEMLKPMLCRFGTKGVNIIYVACDKTVRHVPTSELDGYKTIQHLDGLSPDVCTLVGRGSNGFVSKDVGLLGLTEAIVSMPFIGPFPSGWSSWWKGPHFPGGIK